MVIVPTCRKGRDCWPLPKKWVRNRVAPLAAWKYSRPTAMCVRACVRRRFRVNRGRAFLFAFHRVVGTAVRVHRVPLDERIKRMNNLLCRVCSPTVAVPQGAGRARPFPTSNALKKRALRRKHYSIRTAVFEKMSAVYK